MAKTLLVTGWGFKDYVSAAAMMLMIMPKADVKGVSMRALPQLLEEVEGYDEIFILGVGLAADVKRLKRALQRLIAQQVKITWVSGVDVPDWVDKDDLLKGVEQKCIPCNDLVWAVSQSYGLDYECLNAFWDEGSALGKDYCEWWEAAGYFYRIHQDDSLFECLVRGLAKRRRDLKILLKDRQWMLEQYRRFGHRELKGESDAMNELREKIKLIGPHDNARVLILGETGTGKETVAQLLHVNSPREKEAFIAFNCATVTPNLLESRFLGHDKGAFTGADKARAGLFEQANGGTLFLDEIGELPLEAQGLLLRVLEGGRFMRVGDSSKEIQVDVRVIAATNRDLPRMVREGKFREDLYQRLSVIQLRIPPLREHMGDIAALARDYCWRNDQRAGLSQDQLAALMTYDYPGNVRELFNLLERAWVMGEQDYGRLIQEHRKLNEGLGGQTVPDNLKEAICQHVRRVYESSGCNLSQAADRLGISRNTARKYLGLESHQEVEIDL